MQIKLSLNEFQETVISVLDENDKLLLTKTVSDDMEDLKNEYVNNHNMIYKSTYENYNLVYIIVEPE